MGIEELIPPIKVHGKILSQSVLWGIFVTIVWTSALFGTKPIFTEFFGEYIDDYYNTRRTHLGIDKDCPVPREVEPPENGEVVSLPILGGLHHRYYRNRLPNSRKQES